MDPYAALRYKDFNIFLLVRFAMVFAWSMQFIVIEWQVYSLTKDPLSLGIIGLMEVIPAVSMALFAGHIVDQREKRKCRRSVAATHPAGPRRPPRYAHRRG